MEPKLPPTNRGFEHGSGLTSQGLERHIPTFNLEKSVEVSRAEKERASSSVDSVLESSVLPSVVPPAQVQPDDAAEPDDSTDAPLVAADEDLIEKEWVDKAKKIVISTKDDPYRREAEVSKLQVEYLRKRYGKELGASE